MPSAARAMGKLERLARERHARDLALARQAGGHPRGLWFDDAAADRAVQFIEGYCRHHKGEWAGKPLTLEPWQRDEIVRPLFGWMRADGTRRFREAFIEIARKNGKSELGAAIGLYLTVADQEPGAEVYSSATKLDQAKIVHGTAEAMVKASPELRRFLKTQRNNISCEELGSKFAPLGADSDTLDGLNPHGNIVDEIHAHRDRKVYDVLVTGMGARRQPLTVVITTSGIYQPEAIGWQLHELAVKILEGVLENDEVFAFICAADDEDDWTDPATWEKANPNLGVSVKRDYLERMCEKAQQQPSFLNTFLRLHLDRWTQQRDRWIPIERWNACDATPIAEAALIGRICYGGLDLASKLDIAALVLDFPEDDWHTFLCRFWCPEATIMQRSQKDRVPYDAWVRDGWLTATPGNVIDYDFIRSDVQQLAARFQIKELAYDPWDATQLATQLTGDGFTMVEVRQGFRSLSEPSKKLETLATAGRIRHGDNPVLRWMVSNVTARHDPNDNIAPDKAASAEKIDGVVAAIMALSRAIVQPEDHGSVYETRGVRTL